jgi:hypothetical protein
VPGVFLTGGVGRVTGLLDREVGFGPDFEAAFVFDRVEVSEVKVDGDTATAQVSARPEDEDEATDFSVELRDEDGWKIDGVK